MNPSFALKLVAVCEAYFTLQEFTELAQLFMVQVDALSEYQPTWLSVCKEIAGKLDHGNTRSFVDNLLELAETRNADGVAHQTWERRDYHRGLTPVLAQAQELLSDSATPTELTVSAGQAFTAKSKVRELVAAATNELFVVDPYVGLGTLDCLRDVTVPIRLLAGDHSQAISSDFAPGLTAFLAEGHNLTVRRGQALHDRHLVFNDRCWLVGGSLKDAGKKPFHCIEIIDKATVVADLEARWSSATVFPSEPQ
ncbi:MAG: hypothetical protein H8K08_05305 [Nitrospira sp.]|nr:hypothetical protein [Nitrospira sp.]